MKTEDQILWLKSFDVIEKHNLIGNIIDIKGIYAPYNEFKRCTLRYVGNAYLVFTTDLGVEYAVNKHSFMPCFKVYDIESKQYINYGYV